MKSYSPPANEVSKDTEFFRRDHVDPAPSPPDTEKEIATRKALSDAAKAREKSQEPYPTAPVPAGKGPGGQELETINGVTFIKGTDIVVGGPSQQ